MKSYFEMTDNEINKRVAYFLGYTEQGTGWIDNADGTYDYMSKPSEDYRQSLPDYCNSWADAGPIIHDSLITITPLTSGKSWQAFCRAGEIESRHENPLRAAMIVFLMMKDN